MNHTELRAALKAFVVAGTGIAATSVEWRDGPRTMANFPKASLIIKAMQAQGQDVTSWATSDDPTPGNVAPTISGNRKFTCEVEIRSRDARPGLDAAALAERLRTCLKLPSQLDALRAAKLAIIGANPSLDISVEADGRQEGRVIIEIAFSTLESLRDTSAAGSTSTIEHAQVTSTLTGTDEQIVQTLPL